MRRRLVPVGPLEDARLALEPEAVRLGDVLAARREDVEDEVPARLEQLVRGPERPQLLAPRRACAAASGRGRSRAARARRPAARGGRRRGGRRDPTTPCSSASARATASMPGERSTPITRDPGPRDRHGDPTRADGELDDRAAAALRLVDVERDVLDDGRAPRVVDPRDRVVERHERECTGAPEPSARVTALVRSAPHGCRRTRARGTRRRRGRLVDGRDRGRARRVPRAQERDQAGAARGARPRDRDGAQRRARAARGGDRRARGRARARRARRAADDRARRRDAPGRRLRPRASCT